MKYKNNIPIWLINELDSLYKRSVAKAILHAGSPKAKQSRIPPHEVYLSIAKELEAILKKAHKG